MIGALKSIEPIGFLSFAPASAGTNRADVDRRIIQNCPYGRGAAACAGRPVWFRLRRLRDSDLARENAELRRRLAEREAELTEALEQQTATAEGLEAINSSPGDLAPVFEAILDKAHTLCGADNGALLTYDSERFWPVAWHGMSKRWAELMGAGVRPAVDNPLARLMRGERLVHDFDLTEVAAHVTPARMP